MSYVMGVYSPYDQVDCDQSKQYTSNGSSWDLTEQYDQTFNADSKMQTSIYKETQGGGSMQNVSRTSYTNNSQGRLEEKQVESWSGTAWEVSRKTDYHYNTAGQIDSSCNYSYNNGQWQLMGIQYIGYNAGRQELYEEYSLVGSNPVLKYRETVKYKNGYVDSTIVETDMTGTWEVFYKIGYTYNSANEVASSTTVFQDFAGGWNDPQVEEYIWNNGLLDRLQTGVDGFPGMYQYTKFYYESFTTGIAPYELADAQVKAYPNPDRNTITAAVDLQRAQDVTLSLYNVTGAKVWNRNFGLQQNI